ncbi:MAG: hypothetical protein ACT4PY_13280 [Armatimonadota bacterium]
MRLWLYWLLTTASFPISGGAAFAIFGPVNGIARGALAGFVAGACLGIAQWVGLRQLVPLTGGWILASGIGLSAGLALGIAAFGTRTDGVALVLRGALTGAVLGLGQWILLRQHATGAAQWIPAIAVGWALGWTVTRAVGVDLSKGWTVFGLSGAAVFAALSGLALMWLLRERI